MWYNRLLTTLLRSPFHALLSGSTLALTYTGRKSGKTYTTPVNYVRAGDRLLTTSSRDRLWWRNLRGGAPVWLRLQGREVKALGQAIEDEAAVSEALFAYLAQKPGLAKYFEVALDTGGLPDRDDVARTAKARVMIQFRLV